MHATHENEFDAEGNSCMQYGYCNAILLKSFSLVCCGCMVPVKDASSAVVNLYIQICIYICFLFGVGIVQ